MLALGDVTEENFKGEKIIFLLKLQILQWKNKKLQIQEVNDV